MIIYGTRGVTYSKADGDFHCPQCGGNIPYKHKRVRRFFTLYFIPVIPLDLRGEYIECQKCRGTYRLEVLDLDPGDQGEFEAEFHHAVKRVMVLMRLADGVEVIREIYGKLTERDVSVQEVKSEIQRVEDEQLDVATALSSCAGSLNDHGKAMVVKAAFLVAAADGVFQDEEKEMLGEIGEVLGMNPRKVNEVIRSMGS